MKKISILLILVLSVAMLSNCGRRGQRVMIFHADALSVPMQRIIAEYEAQNPGTKIVTESHGSRVCVDLAKQRRADLLMVADSRLLYEVEPGHWNWNATFATNEIVIAFSDRSKYKDDIDDENWFEILTRPDVRFVHANPATDPIGWWTLIMWQLADLHYGQMLGEQSISEALAARERHDTVKQGANQVVVMLSSPTGIDYGFVYRNQAMEHNLQFVELPREINMSDPALADFYAQATLPPPFEATGAPISFSLTMLQNAPNPEATLDFLEFFFGPRGKALLAGPARIPEFNIIYPPVIDHVENLSPELRKILLK